MLTDIFLTTQQGLVRGTSGCMEVGGLYAALEMVGTGAQLGPLRAKSLSCANPSQFQPVPMGAATLTSTSLGVPPGYGGAHVGAPTLGSSFNATTDVQPRWDLLFEATNQAPELDDEAPVGYAIAHSRTTSFGALAPVDNGARVYAIRYITQDRGAPVEATGFVGFPVLAEPAERPVVLWAHNRSQFPPVGACEWIDVQPRRLVAQTKFAEGVPL